MAYKCSIPCILLETLVFLTIIITAIVIEYLLELSKGGISPFQRGFYCNDQSIMMPYEKSIADFYDVLKVGIFTSLAMILIMELEQYIIKKRDKENICDEENMYKCGPLSIPSWILRMLHSMCVFAAGLALLLTFLDIFKVLSGRLRPHFLAVCQPNTTLYNCSDGYITHDVCTGDPLLVKRARMSMPSGHSAVSMFFAVFVVLCIEAMLCLRKYKIFKMVVQVGIILAGIAVCISRVSDHHHHMSDVLVGVVVGVLAAWVMAFKAMKLLTSKKTNAEYRQIPTAPPPDDGSDND